MSKAPSFVRLQRGTLSTPIAIYQDPATGQKVFIVTNIHVGSHSYYQVLLDFINHRIEHGSRVHYERMDIGDLTKLTALEAEALKQKRLMNQLLIHTAQGTGLTSIGSVITFRDEWLNTDMSLAQLIQRLPIKQQQKLANYQELWHKLGPEGIKKMGRVMLLMMPFVLLALRYLLPEVLRSSTPDGRSLVGERNRLAIAAAKQTLAEPDRPSLVMIWGAAHLAGLHTDLEQLGFKFVAARWFPAFSIKQVLLGSFRSA